MPTTPDYKWHELFGVDGLLSPPHLILITGMLIGSIGVVLGLGRIAVLQLRDSKRSRSTISWWTSPNEVY